MSATLKFYENFNDQNFILIASICLPVCSVFAK